MLLKKLFDIFLSFVGIIFFAPIFFFVAIIIKCDSKGPVFFSQIRIGQYGLPFKIIKFRTMIHNCENLSHIQITSSNDIRITKFGNFLRKYKIDELPQLFNVLKGDMSFVGPRPEVHKYISCYPIEVKELILSVKPGITDWCSIYFRNEGEILSRSDCAESTYINEIIPIKLNYHINYVNNHNFFEDMKILFTTVVILFRKPKITNNINL